MIRPKTFLLPLMARASLILRAAARASCPTHHHRVSFRLARHVDGVSATEQLLTETLRETHAPLFADETDFVVDFTKPSELCMAMEGCDGVVLSTGLADTKAFEIEMNMIKAAKDVGSVADVVKLSCAQGLLGEKSSVALGAQHWLLEQHVNDAQFNGNVRFVRPNTMMDTLLQGKLFDMICGRSLSVSVKRGRVAMVHPVDVADVVSVLLAKPANAMYLPEYYAVSGPEALTFEQVADELSRGIGERVAYSHVPLWEVQTSMWMRGERPEMINDEIQIAGALDEGAEADVTTTVEDVLGRHPRSLKEFIHEHAGAWPRRPHK